MLREAVASLTRYDHNYHVIIIQWYFTPSYPCSQQQCESVNGLKHAYKCLTPTNGFEEKKLIVKKFLRIYCVNTKESGSLHWFCIQPASTFPIAKRVFAMFVCNVCLQCISQTKHKTLSLTLLMQSNQLQTYCKVYCKVQLTEAINVLALR